MSVVHLQGHYSSFEEDYILKSHCPDVLHPHSTPIYSKQLAYVIVLPSPLDAIK